MSEMKEDLQKHYTEEAQKHVDFLCDKVFKPAFMMAFIHGAKHGREDLLKEKANTEPFTPLVVVKEQTEPSWPVTVDKKQDAFEEAWNNFCKEQKAWLSQREKQIAEIFWNMKDEIHNT